MNVQLDKNFPLEHSAESAWNILRNIETVASCMPGAEITEVVDENNFKGKVKVRLGPVNMEFKGDIKVESIDTDNQQIQLIAEGTDNKGTSSVSMDLTANVEAGTEASSALLGDAKVVVNGKLASFGQRMMAQVSDQILDQFADNFRAKVSEQASASTGSADNTSSAAESAAASSSSNAAAQGDAKPVTKPATNNEINGFKFAFQAIVGLITGFFKRK